MKYSILFTNQFKRSYKKCLKRGCDKALFEKVVTILSTTGTLPSCYHPHKLTGQWKGFWECHIQPDWLLIWEQRDSELILILTDTGHTLIYSDNAQPGLYENDNENEDWTAKLRLTRRSRLTNDRRE